MGPHPVCAEKPSSVFSLPIDQRKAADAKVWKGKNTNGKGGQKKGRRDLKKRHVKVPGGRTARKSEKKLTLAQKRRGEGTPRGKCKTGQRQNENKVGGHSGQWNIL